MGAWESARALPCCLLPAQLLPTVQVLFYLAHGKVHTCLASTHGCLKRLLLAGCGVEETPKLLQELGDIFHIEIPNSPGSSGA